jgi:hypothetical protein
MRLRQLFVLVILLATFGCIAKGTLTAPSYSGHRLYHFFITLHGKKKTEVVVWGSDVMHSLFKWENEKSNSADDTNAFIQGLEDFFSTIDGKTFDLKNEKVFENLSENYKIAEIPRIKAVVDKEGIDGLIHKFFEGRDLRNDSGLTIPEQLYLAKLLIESGKFYVASGDVTFRLRITPLKK